MMCPLVLRGLGMQRTDRLNHLQAHLSKTTKSRLMHNIYAGVRWGACLGRACLKAACHRCRHPCCLVVLHSTTLPACRRTRTRASASWRASEPAWTRECGCWRGAVGGRTLH